MKRSTLSDANANRPVADESTAPTGVSFSTADGEGNPLTISDIPAGERKIKLPQE